MIADTSQSTFLFPLSNHCGALDPVLQQIHTKHSDRCIHNAQLWAPECALALRWTICQPQNCQGSQSYSHGVTEWVRWSGVRRRETKSDRMKLTRRAYEHKHKWQPDVLILTYLLSVLGCLNQAGQNFRACQTAWLMTSPRPYHS